jgi:deoxyribodipyrimidine photolyase-related protein
MAWIDASTSAGTFGSLLRSKTTEPKSWVWLAYDQLNHDLMRELLQSKPSLGVVLIESYAKGTSRPYHKQKLALLLSNMRHFALELQAKGLAVRYICTRQSYAETLKHLVNKWGPIHCFEPAERALRIELTPLVERGMVEMHPHLGWLTPRSWFIESVGIKPPFRMDRFYRKVRKQTGWLMTDGEPIGGKFSFDEANRKPWKGDPPAPEPPRFEVDDIDKEVAKIIMLDFHEHPGNVDFSQLPTSEHDITLAMEHAQACMEHFGTYEDAMSSKSRGLFHTRLASLVNLHRVMPVQAIELAMESASDLNNIEGFVRQMIWREYVRHIHEVTDGFRTIDVAKGPARRDARWFTSAPEDTELHPNHLNQNEALPQAYWGLESGLQCLDASVKSVMEEGWTHHIPRLMVLSNIAHLLDINPRELTDWFHVAFIDAYDWVVEPNVLGMGTFALGSAMMTKPYVAGSAYINRMSNHCSDCSFHPTKNCPIKRLYWAYLARHKPAFEGNHRLSMALRNVAKRSSEDQEKDVETFDLVRSVLRVGGVLHPDEFQKRL